jgi:NurA domain-containing protein
MPYEGEFAGYKPLQRIAETERVKTLLRKSRVCLPSTVGVPALIPRVPPDTSMPLPIFAVAIDGSWTEVDVRNGYPGAKVGYCTVASVLLDLLKIEQLDSTRPVDPREFRKTEEASTLDAAMPGCNVVTRTHTSAIDSFREALFDNFHDVIVDADDGKSLLDTYEELMRIRRSAAITCPYSERSGCDKHISVASGVGSCDCEHRHSIYSTDALRIHERFHDNTTNGEAFGEVVQVWERVLLLHLLRWFERRNVLDRVPKIAFVVDGPLAMFGHPAWLSPLIKAELKRLNKIVRGKTGNDLVIIGVEKSGAFVSHFEEVDRTESGEPYFPNRSYALLTDEYIKQRVVFSVSDKPYGNDTYFGRKFFYKTKSGARIVATLPILDDAQDDISKDDVTLYPSFGRICNLLDKLVSSRFPNAVGPIVTAHSHAAIPLTLGTKVLEQLARALMKSD